MAEQSQEEQYVKVKYGGPDGLINYDIAPYNIVEDPVTGGEGQSALLQTGEKYEVPKDLAGRLAISGYFEPADKESKEIFKNASAADEPPAEASAGDKASGLFREYLKAQQEAEEAAKESKEEEQSGSSDTPPESGGEE